MSTCLPVCSPFRPYSGSIRGFDSSVRDCTTHVSALSTLILKRATRSTRRGLRQRNHEARAWQTPGSLVMIIALSPSSQTLFWLEQERRCARLLLRGHSLSVYICAHRSEIRDAPFEAAPPCKLALYVCSSSPTRKRRWTESRPIPIPLRMILRIFFRCA